MREEDGGYITAMDIALKVGDMGAEVVDQLRERGGKTFKELLEGHGSGDINSIPGMPPPRTTAS